ncbi:beta strand repeat-containing protein [Runella aurantiaca]|uniref:Uncharacterized protein n=1 Tax=Runella aurantiaca TaxID=2282308 RepID=A0A369IA54_9BACT|nr:SprB repeat-containing protein [Runella aurantiaca]RDB06629.1 hypothetical protein DVG78_07780 [Runella aurantiaca]
MQKLLLFLNRIPIVRFAFLLLLFGTGISGVSLAQNTFTSATANPNSFTLGTPNAIMTIAFTYAANPGANTVTSYRIGHASASSTCDNALLPSNLSTFGVASQTGTRDYLFIYTYPANAPAGSRVIVIQALNADNSVRGTTCIPITVISPVTPLSFTTQTTNVSCLGGNDGSITVTASGGTSPYQYSKDNGATYTTNSNNVFSGLTAGNYSIRVKDNAGVESTPSIVTVGTAVDVTNPTAIAKNITVQLNAAGTVTIAAADVNNGSTDNCSIATLALDKTTFDCSNLGANTVTLTVTDGSGNFSTVNATVTVEDKINPTAIAQNITVQLNAAGTVTIAAADVNNGSSDNCSVATIALDKTTFDCSNLGANAVVLTVTDGSGNQSTANATVTVEDKINPTAIAKNITVELNAAGTVTISAADVNNGSTDNCSIATLALDKTTFDCSNVGVNSIVLTVTDGSGNFSTATATVTVEDKINPTAIAKNITVQLNAAGTVTIAAADVNNGSTDNCSVQMIELDKTTFDCSNLGNNTVTLTVTDGVGNQSTTTATVTVEDKTNPTAIAQNITVQLNAAGTVTIAAADVNNGSTDNCSVANIALDKTSFNCSNLGDNTVTLTVIDGVGNQSTTNATVTVEDKINPTASAKNITVQLNAAGTVTIAAADVNNGSTDNCSIATLALDKTTFDCSNVGVNSIVLTVTDGSGNFSTATATVTVEDKINPTAIAKNITVQLNAAGTVTIAAADVNNGSTDNCSIATLALDKTTFDCSNLGANTVTLTVTDGSGNFSTANATVTVEDKINPTAIAQNITVELNATGTVTISAADVNNGSTDNCSIATITLDKTTFDCSNLRGNAVVLTVTDGSGNQSTANATVIVKDRINPTAIAKNITVQLNAAGTVTITAADVNNGSTDNCSIATLALSKTDFNCSNLGANTVTLTVTDGSGNFSTVNATVTVEDKINPTAIAKNITVQLNAAGTVTIAAADVNNGSTDNCSVATLSLSKSTFDCSNVGVNSIVLTVTDGSGNQSTANATVTVQDVTKPTVITKNIAVTLGMGGTVDITANDVDNGSSDACGILTKSVSPSSFNAAGNYTVTLTVTDVNGNSDERTATVSVNRRATTLTYSGTANGQYSDPAIMQATLIDNLTNAPISGKNISFTLETQSTSATTDGSGVANSSITLNQAPGNYTVASAFAGDGIYGASSDSDPFAINKENAVATYTGAMFASTANSTSSIATVTLAATIQDITAVNGDANYDAYAGDIAKATFAFRIVEGNITIPATIGYVTPGDTKTGTATATFSANIGNASSESYTVQLLINGYYTGQNYEVITVSKPLNDFITGGGYLILASSAGVKAGDNGTRNNFGFNVKYNKSGKNLQGNINTIVRRMEGGVMHYYQVKGNAMTSLAVQPTTAGGTATFNGKANIQDITDPLNVIAVDGNATLQVEMTDNGEPGSTDMIGITVWNKSGGLWFASNWNGAKTMQQTLGGGNLKASGGTAARVAAEEVIPAEELALDVVIAPNPAANQVKVMLQGWGQTRNVRLRLTDFTATSLGEWNVELNNGSGSTTLDLSSQPLGSYLIIADGDQKRLTKKVLKAGN